MLMNELAVLFFVISSLLVMFRSWMTFNLDRIALDKAPKSLLGFFIEDFYNNYDMIIEPIFKNYENKKADNYRIKVNLVTYLIYFGFLLAIFCAI